MKRFESIDHPSDIGIVAYGKDQKELFENAACGMFSLMTDLKKVKDKDNIEVKVEGDSKESLLVNWLNELIFLEDSKKSIFCKFNISKAENKLIIAKVRGEKIDPARHAMARSIKAATYNQLNINEKGNLLSARIIFDV